MAEPAKHKLDTWPVTVWAVSTKGQLRKAAKALEVKAADIGGEHAGLTSSVVGPGGFHVVVWVDAKNHKHRLDLVNTCAHEASHVADGIFAYAEEHIPGTEARAYLVGWLTEWLLTHCDPTITA